jgi:serine/threonine protein kinase/Flp pilus assembly protein TadD
MVAQQEPARPPSSADSVERSAEAVRRFARSMWLDLVRRDQSERWRMGTAVRAETYFQLLPELREDREEALVLVCGEVRSRCQAGEQIDADEYAHRFPNLADDLAIQFELDGTLGNLSGTQEPSIEREPHEIGLPGFEIIRLLGRGGSSRVYLGRQNSVNRLVAIKVIDSWHLDEQQLLRHRQEASILSRMQHPNIVQIYDIFEFDGFLYSVIEYVDGPTLAAFADGKPQPPHRAADLVRILAEAVHAVHDAGVLHRDLKPSNVLMTSAGQPKISDFGLAKLLSNANSLTTNPGLLGTPSYMPPEHAQGDGRSTDREGDVYSLGAILYELLTGQPPFLGVTILDTLSMIRERDPSSPRLLQPGIPRDLETICLKCLSKSPQARYRTAADLADDLRRHLSGVPIRARRPSPLERLSRWARRNPAVALLTAGLLLTAMLGFAGVVSQWRQAESARNRETLARREADQRALDASVSLDRLTLANGFLERGHRDAGARRWDDAYAAFTRAIELRPDHVPVWEARGEFLYVRLGLWDLAAHDLKRAFELQTPNSLHRWWWNALLRIHEGDVAGYREVCHRLQEHKALNGGGEYAYFLVRSLALHVEKPEANKELVELADELARSHPHQSAYSHLQGLALLRAGRPQEAVDRCRESLAGEGSGFCRELNHPIMALAYQKLGRTAEARAALDKALAAMSKWTTERCELGSDAWVSNLGASGIWPIATWDWLECEIYVREARAALGLDPAEEDPRQRLLRARAFAGLRRFKAADEEYEAALKHLANDHQVQLETHRNRAYRFALASDYQQAAGEFAAAGALSPTDSRLLGFRGLTQLAAGEIDAYRATCAELVSRFGTTRDPLVANDVVDTCIMHAAARPDMRQLVPLAEIAKSAYFGSVRLRGIAQYRAGHYREAINDLEQANRISPLKPRELAFLAMAHHRLGHLDEAQHLLAAAQRWIQDADSPDPNDLSRERPVWGGWYEKVQVPLIVAEARSLIGPAPATRESQY